MDGNWASFYWKLLKPGFKMLIIVKTTKHIQLNLLLVQLNIICQLINSHHLFTDGKIWFRVIIFDRRILCHFWSYWYKNDIIGNLIDCPLLPYTYYIVYFSMLQTELCQSWIGIILIHSVVMNVFAPTSIWTNSLILDLIIESIYLSLDLVAKHKIQFVS